MDDLSKTANWLLNAGLAGVAVTAAIAYFGSAFLAMMVGLAALLLIVTAMIALRIGQTRSAMVPAAKYAKAIETPQYDGRQRLQKYLEPRPLREWANERPVQNEPIPANPAKTEQVSTPSATKPELFPPLSAGYEEIAKFHATDAIWLQPLHCLFYDREIIKSAGSWLGGNPKMPADLEWPLATGEEAAPEGEPLHFIAQICCSDLPVEAAQAAGWPARGTVYLFIHVDGGQDQIEYTQNDTRLLYTSEEGDMLHERVPPGNIKPVYWTDAYNQSYKSHDVPAEMYGDLTSLPKLALRPVSFKSIPTPDQLVSFKGYKLECRDSDRILAEELNTASLLEAFGLGWEEEWKGYYELFEFTQPGREGPAYNFFLRHLALAYETKIDGHLQHLKRRVGESSPTEADTEKEEKLRDIHSVLVDFGRQRKLAGDWTEATNSVREELAQITSEFEETFASLYKGWSEHSGLEVAADLSARREFERMLLMTSLNPPTEPFPTAFARRFLHFIGPTKLHYRITEAQPMFRRQIHQIGGFYQGIQSEIAGRSAGGSVFLRIADTSLCALSLHDAGHVYCDASSYREGIVDFESAGIVIEGH
jgi:hypothetical protein